MSTPVVLRLSVESMHPFVGTVAAEDGAGSGVRFDGWIELLAVISEATGAVERSTPPGARQEDASRTPEGSSVPSSS